MLRYVFSSRILCTAEFGGPLTDRPETVESLFLAYRLTGDPIYREHGWKIFQSIETHCRVDTGGYATIVNVDELPARHEDKMETFMLVCRTPRPFRSLVLTFTQSETLKYLYLLFADGDLLPLDSTLFSHSYRRGQT